MSFVKFENVYKRYKMGEITINAADGVSSEIVWIVVGGFLNFAAGAPIYFSFKKGIFYGVK